TNIARATSTNDVGFFRFAAVEPGDYTVEFKISGFETSRVDPINVSTAHEVTLNETLTISGVSTEVLVTEVPGVQLAKTTPTIERTFPGRLLEDLPIEPAKRDV